MHFSAYYNEKATMAYFDSLYQGIVLSKYSYSLTVVPSGLPERFILFQSAMLPRSPAGIVLQYPEA